MLSKTANKPGIQRIVGIDWSGRVDTAGQRRHIYAGVWTKLGRNKPTVQLENGRTREEIADWLIQLARETPRMVIGIDCCFSFPAWFLREHGCTSAVDFWRHVAAGHGERWLARECPDRRFWGKPHKRPPEFCGDGLRSMFRHTDYDNKIAQALTGGDELRAAKMRGITPKSPFQIGGSGSVGTGSLRAIPFLLHLREAGFGVWPFDSANFAAQPRPLLVEIYTRLMTGAVAKSNAVARKAYLAARRKADDLYANLPRTVMQRALGSEDAFDALITTLEMVAYRNQIVGLRATRNADLRLEGITWRPGIDS